jgi:hypothetical protein
VRPGIIAGVTLDQPDILQVLVLTERFGNR